MYARLLRRLSPIFNNSIESQSSMTISSSSSFFLKIQDEILTISTISNQYTYDLRSYTLQSLAQILTQKGFMVSILANGSALGVILLDSQSSGTSITLQADTTDATVLMKAIALTYDNELSDLKEAISQLNLKLTSGIWLDFYGEILGVPRLNGEPDNLYSQRMIAQRFWPSVNNKAIEQIFNQMGYTSSIIDTIPGSAEAHINLPTEQNGFTYSLGQLQSTLNQLKAAGIQITIHLMGALQDTVRISDAIVNTLTNKQWTWDNFVWGMFNW